jgi:hypothetical protein
MGRAGVGPMRQELESRTSGATAGDLNGDGTIDFDTFDDALQSTGHRIIRHQVLTHLPYACSDAHKLCP